MAMQPVSTLLRERDVDGGGEPHAKTRDDWRKAKELEEARKAGTAPAAVDEEGKDINPHIPQYIASAPWYFGSRGPTLKHQRVQPETLPSYSGITEWYKRGVDVNKIATKYRKGACENCGALTHKRKDCLERPRKIGAKYSGAMIAPDEHVQPNLNLDFDGKRDRWNGYDPSEHHRVIEEYEKIEEAKRQLKGERLRKDMLEGKITKDDIDEEEDEDKYVDDVDMPGTKVDSKQRITVRNLRIREDTAKYLRNLDPNSAYYDPKTRSMRDNPYVNTGKNAEEADYSGENFVRFTGDTQSHAKAQLFAWEASNRGVDVHVLAEPTKLELLKSEYEKKKDEFKTKVKQSILDQYGGEEHLDAPPKSLLLAQSEDYVEYSRHGKIVKGQEKEVIRSQYEEDVFINNHTTVWGSYWKDGQWGYKCCHSFVKNSYCTGSKGRALEGSSEVLALGSVASSTHGNTDPKKENTKGKEGKKQEQKKKKNRKKKDDQEDSNSDTSDSDTSDSSSSDSSSSDSEDEEAIKKKKLEQALIREEMMQAQADNLLSMEERKRPYNSMYEAKAPTEEELEAYFMKRKRAEDPMADFCK